MNTALQIFEDAPLGALVTYNNNEPRPPERFTRKLAAWKAENGTGRLVERSSGSDRMPATFTLHIGNFGSEGTIIMTMRTVFSVDSRKTFSIVETPRPGMVRVLTGNGGDEELRHLAPDMASAERWMASNRYSGMRVEVVSDPGEVPAAEKPGVPEDEHYSDLTLKALIANHGWEATGDQDRLQSVRRTFVGVGHIGGMVVPDGQRNLVAGYSSDAARRRYIALTLGDTVITDIDGRGEDPGDVARRINAAAERYADEKRAGNGLPPLYAGKAANDAAMSTRRAA
jgi:hypothetical protein